MIRVICRNTDFGDAAHVEGMRPHTTFLTFDIEAPTVEAFLMHSGEWIRREVLGIEIIAEEE